jgi:hypothetical protein
MAVRLWRGCPLMAQSTLRAAAPWRRSSGSCRTKARCRCYFQRVGDVVPVWFICKSVLLPKIWPAVGWWLWEELKNV